MNNLNKYSIHFILLVIVGGIILSSCKKGNPNNLPSVSPKDFEGKIQGFDSSGEVASKYLIAYWSFDGNQNESFSGTAPTSADNVSYIPNGVKGQALALNEGYVYYANQIPALGASLRSFTILAWIQIQNNGQTETQIFQLTRPGFETGNIDFVLWTNEYPASNTDVLIVDPGFWDGSRMQDNLNADWEPDGPNTFKSPKIGANVWTQVGVTYDSVSNNLQVWANGIKIGTTKYQNQKDNYYTPTLPNEVIIGGWYNNIPASMIPADPSKIAMVGSIDEVRIYNTALGPAEISALYQLGVAGK